MDWICDELKKFSESLGTKRPMFGEDEYVKKLINEFTEKHIFIVAESLKVGLMGIIAGMFVPHMFNPAIKVSCLTVWWVAEKCRNSRAGKMLFDEFMKISKQTSDLIIVATNISSPIKEQNIIKQGFVLKEKSYLFEC